MNVEAAQLLNPAENRASSQWIRGICRWVNPELIGGPYSYRAVGDVGGEAGRSNPTLQAVDKLIFGVDQFR